jgi:hypothetical protein
MKVRDILDIQNNKMPNSEKAGWIVRMLKARSRRNNPTDTEIPTGWNASPYGGTSATRAGGMMPG